MVLPAALIYSGPNLYSSKEIICSCIGNVFIFYVFVAPDHVAAVLWAPSVLFQLVIMPHQLNLCTLTFSSYRGEEFEHYFILYRIIDLHESMKISMNPGTNFRFVFSWENDHKTVENLLLCCLLRLPWMNTAVLYLLTKNWCMFISNIYMVYDQTNILSLSVHPVLQLKTFPRLL